MYVVTVKLTIDPELFEAFLEQMKENARQSLTGEAGCRQFDICTNASDLTTVFLYERYESLKDFEHHLQTDHYLSFEKRCAHMIANKQVWVYDTLA